METILRLSKLCKFFGPTRAVVDVDLEIRRGEIRGLIGENGSGKSTVSSLIAGMRPPDSGTMELEGQPYAPHNTLDAQAKGINMVVQEMGTISGITVAENIFLGHEKLFTNGGFVNTKKMNAEAQKLLDRLGITNIKPDDMIDRYNFEDRKLVELARALYKEPELFIVDETTTALGVEGRDILYAMMKKLVNDNKAVIFISHDLDELMEVCDVLTVMRDGEIITHITKDQMNADYIKEKMVGRVIDGDYYRSDYDGSCSDKVVISVQNVILGDLVKNVSLELHEGEILGIGGLSGCGMHELGKIIYGAQRPDVGTVEFRGLKGKKLIPWRASRKGMGYISKTRDTEGLLLMASIRENIALPSYKRIAKGGLLFKFREKRFVNRQISNMSIKCVDCEQYTRSLSGGNKQKVVFAKWLGNETEVFVLDCPTRGIDIGVKTYMYQLMAKMKEEGKSVLLISEELPELIGMSDRILIMKDGKISGEYKRSPELSETDIITALI